MQAKLTNAPATAWGASLQTDLLSQLQAHVQEKLGGRLLDFHLMLDENRLILQGRTQTYYVKQLAQHAVMEASPLPILRNRIKVGRQ